MVKKKLLEKLALTRLNTARYPWKWADGSVESVEIVGILEYIPGKERPRFFDELYRILAPKGTAMVKVPYWSAALGVQDYEYEWPPWTDSSFMYFNAQNREALKIDRKMKCDFDFVGGYILDGDIGMRSQEAQQFGAKHYTNAIQIAQLTLTRKP